jgi:GDP-L-fucose synthase
MTPDMLLTEPLEPTNDAYAMGKLAGMTAVRSYRRQYGRAWISCLPTNLYCPGDNYDLATSHVLPALIRRFHEATLAGVPSDVGGVCGDARWLSGAAARGGPAGR